MIRFIFPGKFFEFPGEYKRAEVGVRYSQKYICLRNHSRAKCRKQHVVLHGTEGGDYELIGKGRKVHKKCKCLKIFT